MIDLQDAAKRFLTDVLGVEDTEAITDAQYRVCIRYLVDTELGETRRGISRWPFDPLNLDVSTDTMETT